MTEAKTIPSLEFAPSAQNSARGLDYPLHGYLHTFIVAFISGLALGYAMFLLERILRPLYTTLLLESNAMPKLKSYIVAGVLGTMLHVLLDSPLCDDIRPFYPLSANALYHLLYH